MNNPILPSDSIGEPLLVVYLTSSQATIQNPRLGRNELLVESDTNLCKLGNGVDRYIDLPFFDPILAKGDKLTAAIGFVNNPSDADFVMIGGDSGYSYTFLDSPSLDDLPAMQSEVQIGSSKYETAKNLARAINYEVEVRNGYQDEFVATVDAAGDTVILTAKEVGSGCGDIMLDYSGSGDVIIEYYWTSVIQRETALAYPEVYEVVSSPYRITHGDNGKILKFNSGSAMAATVTKSIPAGFNCTIVQAGAGAVTVSGGPGVNVYNRSSSFVTAGQYAVVSLVSYSANTLSLSGDTA